MRKSIMSNNRGPYFLSELAPGATFYDGLTETQRRARNDENAIGGIIPLPEGWVDPVDEPQAQQAVTQDAQPQELQWVDIFDESHAQQVVAQDAQPQAQQAVAQGAQPQAQQAVAQGAQPQAQQAVAQDAQPQAQQAVAQDAQPQAQQAVAQDAQPQAQQLQPYFFFALQDGATFYDGRSQSEKDAQKDGIGGSIPLPESWK